MNEFIFYNFYHLWYTPKNKIKIKANDTPNMHIVVLLY